MYSGLFTGKGLVGPGHNIQIIFDCNKWLQKFGNFRKTTNCVISSFSFDIKIRKLLKPGKTDKGNRFLIVPAFCTLIEFTCTARSSSIINHRKHQIYNFKINLKLDFTQKINLDLIKLNEILIDYPPAFDTAITPILQCWFNTKIKNSTVRLRGEFKCFIILERKSYTSSVDYNR